MNKLERIVKNVSGELYIRALKKIPGDVKKEITRAKNMEKSPLGRKLLSVIQRNIEIAEKEDLLVCQDTGLPIYTIGVADGFPLYIGSIEESIRKGVKEITKKYPLRSNTLDTLTRERTHTNTGAKIPVIDFIPIKGKKKISMVFVPKGSGSENMSFLKMLKPADGCKAIKKFVLECMVNSGANPCPPVVIGVGIGGTSELCVKLAKKAATRNLNKRNPDKNIEKMERDLLKDVNSLGIGPMGLGGTITALAVNIEKADTHISLNPVAVNMQCWAARRAEAVIHADGKIKYGV
ncbi:MAG: fumarate hydratase [Candidatus Aureabacteria bacterium]|nr:fumarate hydratase [Candidatus Auribacterota bacterium]